MGGRPLLSLQGMGSALNADDLLDSFPEGLLVVGEDGQIIRVSYALLDLLDCPPERVIGRPMKEVVAEAGKGPLEVHSLLSRPTYRLQVSLIANDGSSMPVTFASQPLKDALGNPIAVCTVRDIRDQLFMEARAAELAADRERVGSRLAALIRHLPVGVLAEDDDGLITEANRELCDIFDLGMEPEQLVGELRDIATSGLCLRVENPDAFLKRMVEIAETRDPVLGEMLRLNDGRVLERDYVPVFARSHKGHLWLYRDVTERERTRGELLEATDRAEAANDAKGQFLAMMSHEMRTPLGVIVGLSDLLNGECTAEEQADYLHRLQWNANSLLEQIQDVLDFSRLDAGQLELSEAPFDPVALAEDVACGLALRAHGKGLEMVVDAELDAPRYLLGDEARVRQVLINLVGNAIKFTEQGEVCLHVERGKSGVRFSVQDTGRGIPEDKLASVFERFVRVETSEGARAPGTGLGLAICKILSEKMGGTLAAASTLGEGSVFTMELPLHDAGARPVLSLPPGTLSGIKLLVLDTSDRSRTAVVRALQHAGAQVHASADLDGVRKALDARGAPDVLVYEDGAHGNVGAALTAALGKFGSRVATVAMTPMDARAGSRAAFAVTKPVRRGTLIEAVLAAADRPVPELRPRVSSLPPDGAKELHVLLAEDDPDNRAMFSRVLSRAGFKVDTADNGQKALAAAGDARYDLIVTDLQMPVMNGFELAQGVRAKEEERGEERTPIVALTAHALAGYRDRCLAAGMDEYLTKPVKARQLVQAAQHWADTRPVVLLVDDDPDSRMLMGKYLRDRSDWRCATASGGKAALEAVVRGRVSVVVLDMSMPDMDGYDVARSIRAGEDSERVPIIALTGHTGEQERQKCLKAGCTAYLAKPIRKAELLGAIERELLHSVEVDVEPTRSMPPSAEPAVVKVDPDIADLVPAYLEHRRADIPNLRGLLEAKDFEGLKELGHKIKGSGSAYGFDPISACGKLIEDAARREELEPATDAVDRLTVYLERVTWVAG